MDPQRWRQIEELFDAVSALEPGQRGARLDEACRDDPELRREVAGLLAADESASLPFLEADAAGFASPALDAGALGEHVGPPVGPGEVLGAWRLLREIGHGGSSIVYLAERTDGQYEQQAAVKLLRHPGGQRSEHERRFLAERRILAALDHPNIARILDAGLTGSGWPYVVMEYVDGVPLTEFCDGRRLGLEQRLALFETVCSAVQHAHQRLVVHRDLKPGNILVAAAEGRPRAAAGMVKLLDFGIAKLLAEDDDGPAIHETRTGLLLLTPRYAAPEQVRGGEITTATDVYALGVILYELLTGYGPYALDDTSPVAIERTVCETQPMPPSRVILRRPRAPAATSAGAGVPQPLTRIHRFIRGDLDAIVLKALEKEPERRYGSVRELAEDLRRFRDGEPVLAQAPSSLYRLGKFVGRHRVGVALAAGFLVTVLGFAVAVTAQQQATARERDRANAQAAAAEQTLAFLTDLFQVSDPQQARGEQMTAREALDRGALQIEQTLSDQPAIRARLMATIGAIYLNLGLADDARGLLEEALRLRRDNLGEDHRDTVDSMRLLGRLERSAGDLPQSERWLRQAAAGYTAALGPDHVTTLGATAELANVLSDAGRGTQTVELLRDALALARVSLGEEHETTRTLMINLGVELKNQGRLDEAEPYYREGVTVLRRVLGDDHPDTLTAINNLGLLQMRQARFDEAEASFRQALGASRRVLGDDHPKTLNVTNEMASVLEEQGRLDEAARYRSRLVAASRRVRGDEHPRTLAAINNMAGLLMRQGEPAQALPLYQEVVDGARSVLGDRHPNTLLSMANLGTAYMALGRLDEADAWIERAVTGSREVLPAAHPILGMILSKQGEWLTNAQRLDEAETVLAEAQAILESAMGEGHSERVLLRRRLAELAAARAGGEREASDPAGGE